MQKKLILAVPKGRIWKELAPLLEKASLRPEEDFFDEKSRKLRFTTNNPSLDMIRVRSFDVATFVAQGAAQIGVIGSDVLAEHSYSELYSPLDLGIGKGRLSVAAPFSDKKREQCAPFESYSHIRVATKYPKVTRKYYAQKGIQAECIKLNGAIELAPMLGICNRIVDIVSTGVTLKANGLEELETVMSISSRLIVNRSALKTYPVEIKSWIQLFMDAVKERDDARTSVESRS